MCDSSATAESRFPVTTFEMIFIHLHPREEGKKMNTVFLVINALPLINASPDFLLPKL